MFEIVHEYDGLRRRLEEQVERFASLQESNCEAPSTLGALCLVVSLDNGKHWLGCYLFRRRFTSSHCKEDCSQSTPRPWVAIVFDTLELDVESLHRNGLLDEGATNTITKNTGRAIEFFFLGPICDYQRLDLHDVSSSSVNSTSAPTPTSPTITKKIYYDRYEGRAFRKVIVQPTLQSSRDGTCQARCLAVLLYLRFSLSEGGILGEEILGNAIRFFAPDLDLACRGTSEVTADPVDEAQAVCVEGRNDKNDKEDDQESSVYYPLRSLFATGETDTFGRRFYTLTSTSSKSSRNGAAAKGATATSATATPSSSPAFSPPMHVAHEDAHSRQKQHLQDIRRHPEKDWWRFHAWPSSKHRWEFLQHTCFWFSNYNWQIVKKSGYTPQELHLDVRVSDEQPQLRTMFPSSVEAGATAGEEQRLWRFRQRKTGLITHEGDPSFYEPLEECIEFIRRTAGVRGPPPHNCDGGGGNALQVQPDHSSGDSSARGFWVLPFPKAFEQLRLAQYGLPRKYDRAEDEQELFGDSPPTHKQKHATATALDKCLRQIVEEIEVDVGHRGTRVSDYELGESGAFWNDPRCVDMPTDAFATARSPALTSGTTLRLPVKLPHILAASRTSGSHHEGRQ